MTKTALITGTTSGIGQAFAELLAQEQFDLVLVSRDAQKLAVQAAELSSKHGVAVHELALDLLDPNAAHQVLEFVGRLGVEIEVLINNAGFNECGAFINTDLQKEIEMIQLHVVFATEMVKGFLPAMLKNGNGRILNLGSTGSYIPCPYDAVYAATKAYILSMSKGINAELKGTGVSITTLCPGSTKTEFAKKAGMENTLLFKVFVMDPQTVARIGYRALMKRKETVTAGFYNKLLVLSSKLLPSSVVNYATKLMLTN